VASFLDACLESLLHKFFIESTTADAILDPQSGFVGSFAARAKLAYCLGLIPTTTYTNLDLIGQLRNLFAHRYLEMTFDHPDAIAITDKLVLAKFGGGVRIEEDGTATQMTERPPILNAPKMKLVEVAAAMGGRIPFETQHLTKQTTFESREAA